VKGLAAIPKFEDLVAHPAGMSELPTEALTAVLKEALARKAESEMIITMASVRLATANSQAQQLPQGDRLLNVEEAAAKLRCSKDKLYRHPKEYNKFTVREGRQLRFSEQGIDKWIRQRAGR
jgi:predicted DNA-binding transcriptional regulator AlpA